VPNIEKRSIVPHVSLTQVIASKLLVTNRTNSPALSSGSLSEEKDRNIVTGDRTVDMARMAVISSSRKVGLTCPKNVLLAVHIQRRAMFHDVSDGYGTYHIVISGFARI
jgi:hypothetical protein